MSCKCTAPGSAEAARSKRRREVKLPAGAVVEGDERRWEQRLRLRPACLL